MMAKREIAPSLRPGMHAATFGGNPIASRAGIAMIEMIDEDNLLDHAKAMSDIFRDELSQLASDCDLIKEVRILGMMIGIQLTTDGAPIVAECLKRKLLINCTQQTVIRLLPAMNISESQIREGISILGDVLKNHVV
jgi:acetylornithine/succinyldiaminopimelate/putrescine aminotransferase